MPVASESSRGQDLRHVAAAGDRHIIRIQEKVVVRPVLSRRRICAQESVDLSIRCAKLHDPKKWGRDFSLQRPRGDSPCTDQKPTPVARESGAELSGRRTKFMGLAKK